MKIINRKRSLKLAGLMAAILVSMLAMKATMLFFADYRLLVFEKKDGSWINIAETAEGELSACQSQVSDLQTQKDIAVKAANPDLYK